MSYVYLTIEQPKFVNLIPSYLALRLFDCSSFFLPKLGPNRQTAANHPAISNKKGNTRQNLTPENRQNIQSYRKRQLCQRWNVSNFALHNHGWRHNKPTLSQWSLTTMGGYPSPLPCIEPLWLDAFFTSCFQSQTHKIEIQALQKSKTVL